MVIEIKYDYLNNFSEDLAGMEIDGKWGFIDKSGNIVIPANYDSLYVGFNDGLAGVEIDGKWGMIDKTGKIVIPIQYDQPFSFYNDVAEVELNGETFSIDKQGNRLP